MMAEDGLVSPPPPAVPLPLATPLGYSPPPPPASAKKILLIVFGCLLFAGLLVGGCVAALVLPSLSRARETANRVKCATNLRYIGQGIQMYANARNGQFPDSFESLLVDQDLSSDGFVCPFCADTLAPGATPQARAANLSKGGHLSYVYVGKGISGSGALVTLANTVVAYEPPSNHSNAGINVLFADGHVAFVPAPQAAQLVADIKAGKNPPTVKGF